MSSTRQKSVALAKDADKKKKFSPTKSDNSIHRARNEPERQLGSVREVINNIRRNGETPSAECIATQLSSMHTAQRAPALLALQQTHGNRYVLRVVAGIQAKLKVGQAEDIYEQEADRIAEQVMRLPEPRLMRQPEEENLIRTKPLIEEITPLVRREVGKGEDEELIMTKPISGKAPEVSDDLQARLNQSKADGQALPESVRVFFEPQFGVDFGDVRLHTDQQSQQTAARVHARAFTYGPHIWLGKGANEGDRRLMAHELTHVVQQSGGGHGLNSAPTSIQRLVNESEFFVKGIFIEIDYDNTQVTDDQVRQLLQSLDLLPPSHLPHVPTITVGNRPAQGGGGSAHSGMPGGPYIRLNRSCFNSPWNSGSNNETLLHEVGHIVDWAFDCMRHMRIDNPAGYRALLRHPHRGRTQGPGEHFADAYAHHYMGRQMSNERRNALLTSRAYQP